MTVDVKRLGMVWLREAMLGEEDGSLQAPSALEYGCGELYSSGNAAARPFSLLQNIPRVTLVQLLWRGAAVSG